MGAEVVELVILDVDDASSFPRVCEPWYLNFEAKIEMRIAMTPDDLRKCDLESFLGTT